MTTQHFYFDAASVTPDQVALVIREQLAGEYRASDALRTSVMYLPLTMPASVWVAGAKLAGVNEGTARNRLAEVRNFQREIGEIQ